MSELDWFVTRSSLPGVLKEVLYDLVGSIDAAIEAELDEVSGGFKDRIENIELALNDESQVDSLMDVASLKDKVDDLAEEFDNWKKRVLELEDADYGADGLEILEEDAKKDMGEIEVELKGVEVRDGQVLKEIACPYCGGKIEIT